MSLEHLFFLLIYSLNHFVTVTFMILNWVGTLMNPSVFYWTIVKWVYHIGVPRQLFRYLEWNHDGYCRNSRLIAHQHSTILCSLCRGSSTMEDKNELAYNSIGMFSPVIIKGMVGMFTILLWGMERFLIFCLKLRFDKRQCNPIGGLECSYVLL